MCILKLENLYERQLQCTLVYNVYKLYFIKQILSKFSQKVINNSTEPPSYYLQVFD